jgi:hypothetical protein
MERLILMAAVCKARGSKYLAKILGTVIAASRSNHQEFFRKLLFKIKVVERREDFAVCKVS